MANTPNYWISEARYNAAHTHIDKVRGYPNANGSLGAYTEWTRQNVVSSIEQGYTFYTMFKNSSGNWQAGANIGIVTVNGTKYLRTDSDSKAADNLGNLPEF